MHRLSAQAFAMETPIMVGMKVPVLPESQTVIEGLCCCFYTVSLRLLLQLVQAKTVQHGHALQELH